ncbi:NAD(P)H-dependent flavin oxidoreductase [Pseudohalocynthiibacter aestuariivivens]|jgi:nitronate monooxygenase|uniref:NAD(P)H-dependent flavin oxidoreductase n=1 Tax=Pseudohalocynthiibacter aestuariivivens TaxID=1591409 RepID=A0ABV5JLY7_9RHOB|nr:MULTISPECIES: nitronate monooxygenase [Pseudohalocynthiibacter]MBS9716715.1 nitronate monooxygenase [Pseudohalocynthiibacter aestuariivivens]MCK0101798.1 nitronate monooxygenase [Pseudohalocynthiibacter sp. F2068]
MIDTRLTRMFDLKYPIVSAPMALAAGGKLAAAVSKAGALGLVGGGYGKGDWLEKEISVAGQTPVGYGLITWAIKENPAALETVLSANPRAVFLSFDDPTPYVARIKDAGVPLICQVQTLKDAQSAVRAGADILVAQGREAGGHGETRTTMTLVPEISTWLVDNAPDVLLLAAGGIADGRGLAASLMLGADGVVVGSRLWASNESLAHKNMISAAIAATGDDTIRSPVSDIARKLDWPVRYTAHSLKNDFTDRWHEDQDGLLKVADEEAEKWMAAWRAGDIRNASTMVGESAGLILERGPAGEIIAAIASEAEVHLRRGVELLES